MTAVLPTILFLVVSVTAVQTQILKGPANALKNVGDSVTLECVTSGNNCDQVEWRKMEGAQSARTVYKSGTILNSFPRERYSVSSTGSCNLTIIELEVSDSGKFSCLLQVGDKEETRHSVLVVISVRESCLSNVTGNALNQYDGYSFWTVINVPAKSVEPSNVILSFLNKTVDETETTDESQSQIIKTTLTGIARNEHITQRACMASFPPNTAADFDNSTATLHVCTTGTSQLIGSSVQSQILKGPVNALKKVGDSVTLECVTSSNDCDMVEWKKLEGAQSARTVYTNGMILNGFRDGRYSVNSSGGCNLTIKQLDISDSGRFSCVMLVDDREEIRSSILVVIDLRESCLSNVTSSALNQNDGYTFLTVINVPVKSVEPSNVIMSFQNITVDETETMDSSQPLIVKTTLTGIARKKHITQRVCTASLPPNSIADFDNSTATLDVCTTQQLIVSPVQAQILKGPVNALKRVGDNVTLECVTSGSDCEEVHWSKMEGAQSPQRVSRDSIIHNGFPGDRYSVSSIGGCSLTIRELEVNDSGRFSCVLTVGEREEMKSSVLVVISVRESCLSNVTSNALNQNDSYRFWTAINVPDKSVEPSNVILSFQNEIIGETETMDDSQSLTVKTTLTGIARNEHIAQRVCRASFPPRTAADFDRSTATLDVCTTQQMIVSYPVENVTVWPIDAQFHEGDTVSCTADGYPMPTFLWKNLTSGLIVQNGGSLNITKDSFGHNFSCIATNIVNGKNESQKMMAVVENHSDESDTGGCSSGCIAGITTVFVVAIVCIAVGVTVVVMKKTEQGRRQRLERSPSAER